MKVLFVSAFGESFPLALHLLDEGHDPAMFIQCKGYKDVGEGFKVKRIGSLDECKRLISSGKVDLSYTDECKQKISIQDGIYGGGELADQLRKLGKPVIGGNAYGDKLENDRLFAQSVFKKAGMDVVPVVEFHTWDAGKKFLKKEKGSWAIKHCGQTPRDLNGAFFDPEEMMSFLEWSEEIWDKETQHTPVHFIFQQAVKGIEIAVTGFVRNGEVLPGTVYLNQETKKLMNGGYGPSSGQVSEVGRFIDGTKLYEQTIAKIAPLLGKDYLCWMDINCIIAKDKVVPLEATCRNGLPTAFSFIEGVGNVGDFFESVLKGKEIKHSNDWITNVVVATGTFPNEDKDANKKPLILGLENCDLSHTWPYEIRMEGEKVRGAGEIGNTVTFTAKGKKIEDSFQTCLKRTEQVKVLPFKKIRTDGYEKAVKDFPQLEKDGWI
jgi:phosphoribosylamine--glycine ligase